MYTDPKRTIRLLDELVELGFTEDAFQVLHHFEKKKAVIRSHRAYCQKQSAFDKGGTNSKVQQRLEVVLRSYWGGGFSSSPARSEVFFALAEAAVAEIPK